MLYFIFLTVILLIEERIRIKVNDKEKIYKIINEKSKNGSFRLKRKDYIKIYFEYSTDNNSINKLRKNFLIQKVGKVMFIITITTIILLEIIGI
jgi:hypothetical protein